MIALMCSVFFVGAIQNARTSYMGDTFNRDGYHLEVNYVRYTAACTWYEAIRGKSVAGNPVFIDFGGGSTAPSAAWNRVTVASTASPIYLTCM